MLASHSSFAPIEEENFLVGSRLLESLGKLKSPHYRTEFKRDCRRFLEEFTSTILSTVAARSPIAQGLSCFCPEIIVGGDDTAVHRLFQRLIEGLVGSGWVKRSNVEACQAEFESFVREQRQLNWSKTDGRPDVGSVFSFLLEQSGFKARQNLYRVSFITFPLLSGCCNFAPF